MKNIFIIFEELDNPHTIEYTPLYINQPHRGYK